MADSTPVVRRLGPDDALASRRLGAEAFGAESFPVPAPARPQPWPVPGVHPYGVHEAGELVAKVVVRDDASWWGGARLATAGIAGVAVRPEHRGRGLLTPLFERALHEARERGAVISTLYATAPGIYRRFGYEVVGELTEVELPTASLARVAAAPGVALHRVGADEVDAVRAVYDAWAADRDGPLTRRGACWPDPHASDDPLAALLVGDTAATLALEDGRPTGYATWLRPAGYDETGRLEVSELVALTPGATSTLWAALGSFAPVAPTTRVTTSGADVVRLALPGAVWRPVVQHPYSLRVLDLPGSLAERRVGLYDGRVRFAVEAGDDPVAGGYELVAGDGRAACTRTADPADTADGPVLTATGLSALWAGAHPCAHLRAAGLLRGPTAYDAALDTIFAGRGVAVHDYF